MADEAHPLQGERAAVAVRRILLGQGQIAAREDADPAGHGPGRARVHLDHARMRMVREHEPRVEHAGLHEIGGEAGEARGLLASIHARQRLANGRGRRHCLAPILGVYGREIFWGEGEVEGARVLAHVLGSSRLRDGEERGPAREEVEGDLARRLAEALGDVRHRPSHESAAGQRRVADHGDPLALAMGEHVLFDGAVTQVVEDLIAGEADPAEPGLGGLHLGHVEIADPDEARLAGGAELDHGPHGVGDGVPPVPPVEEIEIHVVRAQALERALARLDGASIGGIRGHDLGGDEGLVAPAGQGLGHDLLGVSVAVHLGRVDMAQAEIETERQRSDLVLPELALLAHVPGALAYDRQADAGRAERAHEHAPSVHRAPKLRPAVGYWMTSCARASTYGGMVSPSAFAALRLMTSSNFVGCSTGRSASLAPLRIRSTKAAARRYCSAKSMPYDMRPPPSTNVLAS